MPIYIVLPYSSSAIDHRTWTTGLPVRSAVLKTCAGRLVVGWVTTSEYLLLIVLLFSFWFNLFAFRPRRLVVGDSATGVTPCRQAEVFMAQDMSEMALQISARSERKFGNGSAR
jgi:hypothetical protein